MFVLSHIVYGAQARAQYLSAEKAGEYNLNVHTRFLNKISYSF